MKPSWSDAPEWAKYLAMDEDGCWWWHEKEPVPNWAADGWSSGGESELACDPRDVWRDTLEPRPLDTST